jgi:hypothetical protein
VRIVLLLAVLLTGCPSSQMPPRRSPTPIEPAPKPTAPPAEPAPPARRWRAPTTDTLLLRDDEPPPTGTGWDAASKAKIWGLADLGCDARRTSAWLRIRCPFGTTEAKPTLTAFGNGAWEVTWTETAVELTLPIGPGLWTAVTVGMGDGLIVDLRWRPKTPIPDVLGSANGAGPPACGGDLVGSSGDPARYHELADCRRADHRDCEALRQCLYNAPTHRPACPEGWVFQGICVLPCASANECGPAWTCEKGPAGKPACTPPN